MLEDSHKLIRHRRSVIGQSNRPNLISQFRRESILDLVPSLIIPQYSSEKNGPGPGKINGNTKPTSFPLNTTNERIYNTPCLQGDPRLSKRYNSLSRKPNSITNTTTHSVHNNSLKLDTSLGRLFPTQNHSEFLSVSHLKKSFGNQKANNKDNKTSRLNEMNTSTCCPLALKDVLGFQVDNEKTMASTSDHRKISLLQAKRQEIGLVNEGNGRKGMEAGSLCIAEPSPSCRSLNPWKTENQLQYRDEIQAKQKLQKSKRVELRREAIKSR